MSRRLEFDPIAEDDLNQIYDYIFERNPDAADRYIRELQEQCLFYAESPFLLGQAESEVAARLGLPSEQTRSFPYRNHRCFYVLTASVMRVLGFIDMRSDVEVQIETRFG